MAEHEFEKLLGGFAADTLTPEERRQLFTAAMQDQQLFNTLADEQALKELLTDPAVRRRLLQALHNATPVPADKPGSWLDWFRRPANLALAGGLATVVFAVVLGTKVYQDSLKQNAHSGAMEDTTPPQSTAPMPTPKETDAAGPTIAKKEMRTDKLALNKKAASSQIQEYRPADSAQELTPPRSPREKGGKQPTAPSTAPSALSEGAAASADRQLATGLPAPTPEPMIVPSPAQSAAPVADEQPISARALFYGEGVRADAGKMLRDNERAMKPLAESAPQAAPLQRKMEGLSQFSKAAGPATASTPLGLRYSFVVQNSDGQEQEVDAAAASRNPTPVQLTIESNQDGYIQVWRNVGAANTQLLLPLKASGHISMKIPAGQRQRLPLPAGSGTVIVRLSRVPFGPISRQEAALLNRRSPNLIQESVATPHPTGSQERATYVISQDPSPTAQIAVDILLAQQQ
ncbi:hypothetical protein [Nitrospira lenta]|uniref:DUF4384 domain-containing protein n=1 Tax=Nitrospira lenta TaxID=1436998 RepID=A0A330L0A5_9BACT|nr:hypothetical protein [Nitrospira lenta]SPP63221.1 conserved hypothetical protein [Nitrospira lenta]